MGLVSAADYEMVEENKHEDVENPVNDHRDPVSRAVSFTYPECWLPSIVHTTLWRFHLVDLESLEDACVYRLCVACSC